MPGMMWKAKPESDIRKRIAKFSIDGTLITDDPEMVMRIMSKMIIIRAEHHFHNNIFEYTALSPEFRTVDNGEMIPEINIWPTKGENGIWRIGFTYSSDADDRFHGIL